MTTKPLAALAATFLLLSAAPALGSDIKSGFDDAATADVPHAQPWTSAGQPVDTLRMEPPRARPEDQAGAPGGVEYDHDRMAPREN
jgi:hypothetical protein